MAAIEIRINNQKYVIKSDSASDHLGEVVEAVQEKIDSLLHDHPTMTATKAALLAAVEFSSQSIATREKVDSYRTTVLSKAGDILERIERELSPTAN